MSGFVANELSALLRWAGESPSQTRRGGGCRLRQTKFQERRRARGVPVRALPEIHESPAGRRGTGGEAEIGKETLGVAGKPAGEWLCAWISGESPDSAVDQKPSELLTFGRLAREQEGVRVFSFAADLERTEVLVPGPVGASGSDSPHVLSLVDGRG